MKNTKIHIGNSALKSEEKIVKGNYVLIDDEPFYEISNYDQMPPFFMSIVSDSDHWMFIFSNGALTAGRKNPDSALFPYYTDDKIQDNAEITGSKTVLLVEQNDKTYLWEPFSSRYDGIYHIERKCYKNIYGNKLIFKETNHDLQITFQYAWLNSDKFGFIKKSKIINNTDQSVSINILDGIQNILPYGIGQKFQNDFSTLIDAYKKNELDIETGLGVYSLSSIPVDKAEPSEALKATTVWSTGISAEKILISSRQIESFRKGLPVEQESGTRTTRGSYLINSKIDLEPGNTKTWYIVSEIEQDSKDIIAIKKLLYKNQKIEEILEEDITKGTENLLCKVAKSDGIQMSADILNTTRHFSNVLFNIMRGGIFIDDYKIDKQDFLQFLFDSNKQVYEKYQVIIENLPEELNNTELVETLAIHENPDLEKLCYEYLPLSFSRRHGDPSRPWNRFSIEIKNAFGEKNLNYQGNWRDIFQNWEALALSFPEYIESMIVKFLNASTADGYNPYRVTRDGFDWEIIDPDDPWSYIGYWGDHQIIYLLKLLEASQKFHPGRLQSLLRKNIFAYANVPYRIKSYPEILTDPHNTIDFDVELDNQIKKRFEKIGSDGKFIYTKNGKMYQVNLAEKILVPILGKLTNFIPEAGIWMNTQRPEWNDANNALVGFGVSMVTLYYLRRHLKFCHELFKSGNTQPISISEEAAELFSTIFAVFKNNIDLLKTLVSDSDRKRLLDRLGKAGSDYREKIYTNGFSEKKTAINPDEIAAFCETAIKYIDHSIRANKRDDLLYHSYTLMKVENRSAVTIRRLYEMLEGQVAVLSSGFLSPEECVGLLKALRNSSLYREDQHTYILYPDRELPKFVEKNKIPKNEFEKSDLLKSLIKTGDKNIVIHDVDGGYHFNGVFRNASDLKNALEKIKSENLQPIIEHEKESILKIFDDLFDHQSFTGRSGTFFKYEGLGSTYWHMVSKLLLAVQENYFWAEKSQAKESTILQLKDFYYEIKEGIGVHKSPNLYGAFPTDPYSHTPAHAGVQQPGMTGQVKEDILSRFGELGIKVSEGRILFQPTLLRKEEFLTEPGLFTYYNVHGKQVSINLESSSLAFTFAQTPVIYHLADKKKIVITKRTSETETTTDFILDENVSASIFGRKYDVQRLDVYLS